MNVPELAPVGVPFTDLGFEALSTNPGMPSSPLGLPSSLMQRGKPSLDKVASDFEAMFASVLLKSMRQTLEPDGLFPQDHADVFGGLFDLYLGQHIAQHGGLGVAPYLKRQLEKTRKQ
jgi:Rod binding domain-containing protein